MGVLGIKSLRTIFKSLALFQVLALGLVNRCICSALWQGGRSLPSCSSVSICPLQHVISYNQSILWVGVPQRSWPRLMTRRSIDAAGKCDRCLGHKASLGLLINYYVFYYVLVRHNGSKTYSSVHTHIQSYMQIHPLKTQKDKNSKTVKRNRTGKTRVTLGLLYCAGECVPYSLLYCMPADVSRWQTVQTFNCNKSLWYYTWQRK